MPMMTIWHSTNTMIYLGTDKAVKIATPLCLQNLNLFLSISVKVDLRFKRIFEAALHLAGTAIRHGCPARREKYVRKQMTE
jgi:hypothetical protein